MKYDATLRPQNRELVRAVLRKREYATKSQIAEATGLSLVTAGSIITELERAGEVLRGSVLPSDGGRPSATFVYNADFAHAAVLCMTFTSAGQTAAVQVVDLLGRQVDSVAAPLPEMADVPFLGSLLDSMLANYPDLRCICVVRPGVEQADGALLNTPEALRWLLPELRQRYGCPVFFENDINAAALGWLQGQTDTSGCTAALYFPRFEPPGAGIAMDGKVYRGKGSFAGEFAYIPTRIPWKMLDYNNETDTAEMIAGAVVTFCCTLAPSRFVLYGDFWTETLRRRVTDAVAACLEGAFSCPLTFRTDILPDLQTGAIWLALERLRALIAMG